MTSMLFCLSDVLYTSRMPSYAVQFRSAMKDRSLVLVFLFAALMLAANVGLLLWKLPGIGAEQGVIALHYNVFFGVDRVGAWQSVFLIPALAGGFLLVNFVSAVLIHANERFVSKALALHTLVVNFLLALASLFVLLANI